jgi:5,10-methenyltetrahydromethanopterin hydrogenase
MATQPGDNEQRLRDVNMLVPDQLPKEYQAVVDSLTPDELETLVSVKKRFDEAERVSGTDIGENIFPP